MAKRKYIKRSEYWSQFKDSTPNHNLEDITNQSLAEEFSPELVGESVLLRAILKIDLRILMMDYFRLITRVIQ